MLRELALSGLEWAGIKIDPAANDAAVRGRSGQVQAAGSMVKVRPLLRVARPALHCGLGSASTWAET